MYGSSSSMQRVQGSVVDYCSSEVRAAVLFSADKVYLFFLQQFWW
jgi:hypothetical protein